MAEFAREPIQQLLDCKSVITEVGENPIRVAWNNTLTDSGLYRDGEEFFDSLERSLEERKRSA